MPRHHVVRMLPYAPEELFEMVGDVDAYPEFVPWITGLKSWNRHEDGEGIEVLDAEATVCLKFLREKFATRVRRDPNSLTVSVALLHGPFKRLSNRLHFNPPSTGATNISYTDFAFKAPFLDAMLAANFDRAVSRLMGCFEARAAKLYAAKTVKQA